MYALHLPNDPQRHYDKDSNVPDFQPRWALENADLQ